jgi:hypothetical protein
MWILIFSTTFVWNISLSTKNRARCYNICTYRSSCKVPLLLSDFNETWIFVTDFREILKYQILWKSFHWKPSGFTRTNRHDEAKSRISQFCERSQKPISFSFKKNYFFKFETRFLIDHNFVGSLCYVAVRHDTWHCSYQRTPPSINCANWQAVSTHRSVA